MRRCALGAAIFAIVIATSCREPTVVRIEATTNVPFRAGITTSFSAGADAFAVENGPPQTASRASWGADGFVGSLAVVPVSGEDGPLSIRLVMGVDRPLEECSVARPDGCIFVRRRLSYRPHETLVLPIFLYSRCVGVVCDPTSTCNREGRCLASTVECGASECTPPGELTDGGIATVDAPTSSDAYVSRDSSGGDGSARDDAGDAADSGGTAGQGTVECPPAVCSVGQQCCWDPGAGVGSCVADGTSCGLPNLKQMRCDSANDCVGGCCAYSSGSTCGAGCAGQATLCETSSDCQAPQTCTRAVFNHYKACQ